MNDRTLGTLGTIAVICAPAFLIDTLLLSLLGEGRGEAPLTTSIMGTVFMAGWICANIGLQRLRATGTSLWGRAVLLVQLVGLVLAFMFGFFEVTGLLANSIVFGVMNAAWPLSMLWMLVVGVTVLVAKRLSGWRRFVPLLCGLALPLSMVAAIPLDEQLSDFLFGVLTAVFWIMLGYIVRGGEQRAEPAFEPAVR